MNGNNATAGPDRPIRTATPARERKARKMIAKTARPPVRERYESSVRKSVLVVSIALGSQAIYIIAQIVSGGHV
jgi:hypothetical protein